MDGYDRGFRQARGGAGGRGGYGRGINRSSYDYQFGANPEAYRPPRGMGGYGFGGRSFAGDEVGSYGSEFGAFPPRDFGRGFGGGTFIGAEGGASAGYGRNADDLAGQDFRFSGGYGRQGGFGRGGYGDFQRGTFGGEYEAGNFGGLRGAVGRGYGGYGADYGADMGSYDADYGGPFMGGLARSGYDAGYGDFGARSGGMGGFGGQGVRGYDAGYGDARGPFMPEEAYRRHPEYIQPPQRRGMHTVGYGYSETFDGEMSDEEVLHRVRTRLHQDRWVDADLINVEVEDGVVTLTGEVGDFMEARYAWDDAWETPGVHGVMNSLTVRTDLPNDPHGDVVPQSGSGES